MDGACLRRDGKDGWITYMDSSIREEDGFLFRRERGDIKPSVTATKMSESVKSA